MTEIKDDPTLTRMVGDLTALGSRLRSVVLYGSAARGDFHRKTSDFNLLLVLEDLSPATLEALEPALRRWTKAGQPVPRLFSPAVIAESADVFPIEFLDIRRSHVVLHGEDPLDGLEIHTDHLRLQCERELREKMMRLREGEVVAAFCKRAELDREPFDEVDRLKRGEPSESDLKVLFSRYYEQLTRAVHQVNRFDSGGTA